MTMRAASAALCLLAAAWPAGAGAATCRSFDFEDTGYTLCEATHGADDLRLWLDGPDGRVLGTFQRLREMLAAQGLQPAFAMNAGMYKPDRTPVGLYVEEGQERHEIVTQPGPGNFGMKPNGVFCVTGTRFAVIDTAAFAADPPACRFATQSGPLLVGGGQVNARFLAGSDSLYVRNGVGVSADGQRAVLALSDGPVNFDSFARMFRDGLGLGDALYFDGNISRLYAPGIGRDDLGLPMGPMVGVAVPLAE